MNNNYRYFDQKCMTYNFQCPVCNCGTWAREGSYAVYEGKKFLNLHTKEIEGVFALGGYIFCGRCYDKVKSVAEFGE